MGFHASAAELNRRLMNIRKNPARYGPHGLLIPTATKIEPHPSVVPKYAHVIEFSLSRLHSRYGVTIDDILIDPELGKQYEDMARMAAPELSSLDLRLAALYIRKTRYIAKQNKKQIESLDPAAIEPVFVEWPAGRADGDPVPAQEGIIEVLDRSQYLYISRSEDLRSVAEQITSESSLNFMANEFWRPKRENLVIRFYAGHEFLKVPVLRWQLKLITEKKPVFNWPIAA